jgi:hypothetical protein
MDVKDIFKTSELMNFWPTAKQSAKERVMATTRFILYATIVVYLINRDAEVTLPTVTNPMGNVLMSEYTENPDRPPAAWYPSVRGDVQAAWSTIHPFERVRDAERNFYTTASSTIPNDQNAFATAAYGKQFAPMCKDQGGRACDPDNFQFHFPERTQMRGGNGR